MPNPPRTNQEQIKEISLLKQRIRELEISEAERKRAEQEVTVLAEIGRVIGSTLHINEVYEQFANMTKKLIPFDAISINLIDVPNNLFHIAYHSGLDVPGRTIRADTPLTGTMTGKIMNKRKSLKFQVSGAEELNRLYPEITQYMSIKAGFISNMLIPLFAHDAVIAVLHFRAKRQKAYSNADVSLAERIGVQIAGAIANAQLYKDLRTTETLLRESSQRHRTILQTAMDGFWLLDLQGRLLDVNESYCRMSGYSATEIRVMNIHDLETDETTTDIAAHVQKVIREGEDRFESRHRRKDGSAFDVEISVQYQPADGGRLVAFLRDISERKRAEETQRRSEERYHTLFSRAGDGITIMSLEGELIEVNKSFARMHGYSTDEILQINLKDLDTPETLQQARERNKQILADEVYTFEVEHYHKDGHIFPLEVLASLVTTGEKPYFQCFHRDISERKRAEQEKTILAEIGRVIGSTLDIDEVYERFAIEVRKLIPLDRLTVNIIGSPGGETAYRAYVYGLEIPGREQGETSLPVAGSVTETLIRTRKSMIIQPVSQKEITSSYPSIVAAFRAGIRSTMGVPLIARDTVIGGLHFHSTLSNRYNEETLRLAERIGMQIAAGIANAQLFNDLKKTEKSLRESEVRFRLAFRTSPDAININRMDTGMFVDINEGFTRLTGFTREDVIGKTSLAIDLWCHPEDRKTLVRGLQQKGYYENLEAEFRRKDGSSGPALMSARVLDLQGVPHILSITRDISDIKRAEEEKRHLEERLQRAEKMEALGQLAGGVAHDLNNVLGILSGYSELLLEQIPEGNRSRNYVEKILQSTEKGAAIIQDLLTLARRGVVASDVINLNSVVSAFFKTPVFEKIKDHHPRVTFKRELDRNLLNIKGSFFHLEKTLMNLVSNASEAISGAGEVTIKTQSRYLDKPIRGYDEIKEGDYAVLTISDTGMGIPAENILKIFEPFYTKKKMGRSGTGLGLAIVWGTIRDHNGYIDVETEVGKGTTFTLYFPVTREELMTPQQKEQIERYMGKGESVLVVDDIAEQRDIASLLLKRLGYQVHAVSSGEEAVEHLKGNKADMLVLDMIMTPGIDGLETYQRVLEINPTQKAILVSGFSETERVKKAQELGAGAYVKKPYVMEKIGIAIRDGLDRK